MQADKAEDLKAEVGGVAQRRVYVNLKWPQDDDQNWPHFLHFGPRASDAPFAGLMSSRLNACQRKDPQAFHRLQLDRYGALHQIHPRRQRA